MSDTVNPDRPDSHGTDAAHGHGVRFERDDITAGPVVKFVVVLIILTALTMVGVLWMMRIFNDNESKIKKTPWEIADERQIKEQEGKELGMSVGPIAGDAGRNRFRGQPGSDGPARNRSSLGNTPRLEGIDLHNPDDPVNHLPEHTVGRIYPGAAKEQREREDKYLNSWAPFANEGAPGHVPIEVAMKHLAKATGSLPPDEWQEAPGRSSSGRVSRAAGSDAAALGHDAAVKEQPAAKGQEGAPKEHHEEAPKK